MKIFCYKKRYCLNLSPLKVKSSVYDKEYEYTKKLCLRGIFVVIGKIVYDTTVDMKRDVLSLLDITKSQLFLAISRYGLPISVGEVLFYPIHPKICNYLNRRDPQDQLSNIYTELAIQRSFSNPPRYIKTLEKCSLFHNCLSSYSAVASHMHTANPINK